MQGQRALQEQQLPELQQATTLLVQRRVLQAQMQQLEPLEQPQLAQPQQPGLPELLLVQELPLREWELPVSRQQVQLLRQQLAWLLLGALPAALLQLDLPEAWRQSPEPVALGSQLREPGAAAAQSYAAPVLKHLPEAQRQEWEPAAWALRAKQLEPQPLRASLQRAAQADGSLRALPALCAPEWLSAHRQASRSATNRSLVSAQSRHGLRCFQQLYRRG